MFSYQNRLRNIKEQRVVGVTEEIKLWVRFGDLIDLQLLLPHPHVYFAFITAVAQLTNRIAATHGRAETCPLMLTYCSLDENTTTRVNSNNLNVCIEYI